MLNCDRDFVLFSYALAAVCILAIPIIAVFQKRRTKAWPPELTTIDGQPVGKSVFKVILMADILIRTILPQKVFASIPVALVMAGLDLSLALALASLAALAISRSFRPGWSWRTGLQQTYFLIFAVVVSSFVAWDLSLYRPIAWIWMLAVLEASFLVPALVRLAYIEYYQRYTNLNIP